MAHFLKAFLLLFALSFTSATAMSADPSLSPEEAKEIIQFSDPEMGKGNLLTPPRGKIRPEIEGIRSFVKDIIEELAGADIKAKGFHYVVNVYGNNSLNAWVQQFSAENENSQEAKWLAKHPGEVWPLRKAWGIPDDKMPIFEIGVTTELLKQLDTKDELAFILAHEVTHLLEGHTDHANDYKEAFRKWWSSQSHEVVADYLGVERLIGKYELEAALTLLAKIHPKRGDTMSVDEALSSAASTHHAEGVRISSIQFFIEYLRHFHPDAGPIPWKEIPQALRVAVFGRQKETDPTGKATARTEYFTWIEGQLRGIKSLDNFFYDRHHFDPKYRDPFAGLIGSPTEESFAQLLFQTAQIIENSKSDKVTKMNTFLRAMVLAGSRAEDGNILGRNWLKDLDSRQLFKITRFLLENSIGEGAWTLADLKQTMGELPFKSRKYIEGFLTENAAGLKMFDQLSKLSPSWMAILNHWSSFDSFKRDGLYEMTEFAGWMRKLGDAELPEGNVKRLYRQKILADFSKPRDIDQILGKIQSGGMTEFQNFGIYPDPKIDTEIENWKRQMKVARAQYVPAYQQLLFQQVTSLLSKEEGTRSQLNSLSYALNDVDWRYLNDSDRNQLQEAYDIHIRQAENPARSQGNRPNTLLSKEELKLIAKIIQSRQLDRKATLMYLRYILVQTDPSYWKDTHLSQETVDVFAKVAKSLTKEEILHLHETQLPFEREIWDEVEEFDRLFRPKNTVDMMMKIAMMSDIVQRMAWANKTQSWEIGISNKFRVMSNLTQFLSSYSSQDLGGYSDFKASDLSRTLTELENAIRIRRFTKEGRLKPGIPMTTAKVLFEIFQTNLESISSFEKQVQTYERILKLSGSAFIPSAEQEKQVRQVLMKSLNAMQPYQQFQWLKNKALRKALGAELTGEILARYVHGIIKKDRNRLGSEVNRVLKAIPLREQWQDAFKVFRNQVAELAQVQPSEILTVFAEDPRSITQRVDTNGNLIRGMSSFSTFTKALPVHEQLEMIEFIMGRSMKMPQGLIDYKAPSDQVDVKQLFYKLREEMKFRTPVERAMVVNSVFAGPNGLPNSSTGLEAIHGHLLSSISPKNREIAQILLKAIHAAEGRNGSMILAYALAQKVENSKGREGLNEALILRSLLDFFGVPGVKLAQYLAFTSEFKDFHAALEIYQDAAMPISHYDALVLLEKSLGSAWDPSLYKVIKVVGSGSVNIAIEYLNLKTGKSEVITMARDDIEVKTREDFRRFRLLIQELTGTEALKKKFNFIVGLIDIIQKSVRLEFDKLHSFTMQKSVQKLYRQNVDGWQIQTVDAFEVMKNAGIRMEKAPGIGARKVLNENPSAYESAMRALMRIEYAALRGVNELKNWIPMALFANPDFHDGQVMIDVEKKIITILDFGQALPISNLEREFALDILRIVSNNETAESTAKLIQKHAGLLDEAKVQTDLTQLREIIQRKDRMEVFVHLVSYLSRSGFDVPLSTVHWVLGANRLIKLGEKLRISTGTSFKWLAGMRKVGLPGLVYNAAKEMQERARDKVVSLVNLKPKSARASVSCLKAHVQGRRSRADY